MYVYAVCVHIYLLVQVQSVACVESMATAERGLWFRENVVGFVSAAHWANPHS